jgi:hypothetical protein
MCRVTYALQSSPSRGTTSRAACWHCTVFPRLKLDLCVNTASAGFFDYFSLRIRKVPALSSGPALLTGLFVTFLPTSMQMGG